MIEDKVSIVIPVFNGGKTIERSIKSCTNQSYYNIEIIVVNNGSKDNTEEVIKSIKDDRILLLDSSKGRSKARNIGINNSNGEYLVFLDADDTLSKDSISNAVSFLKKNSDYFAYTSSIRYINEETGELINTVTPSYKNNNDLERYNPFPINSIVFRNNSQIRFLENLNYNEDWLYFADLLNNRRVFVNNQKIGGDVYIHENNTMRDLEKMIGTQLLVKKLIKKNRNKKNTFIDFFINIKLLIIFILISHPSNIRDQVKMEYKGWYATANFLCKIPILSFVFKNKLEVYKREYYYK